MGARCSQPGSSLLSQSGSARLVDGYRRDGVEIQNLAVISKSDEISDLHVHSTNHRAWITIINNDFLFYFLILDLYWRWNHQSRGYMLTFMRYSPLKLLTVLLRYYVQTDCSLVTLQLGLVTVVLHRTNQVDNLLVLPCQALAHNSTLHPPRCGFILHFTWHQKEKGKCFVKGSLEVCFIILIIHHTPYRGSNKGSKRFCLRLRLRTGHPAEPLVCVCRGDCLP